MAGYLEADELKEYMMNHGERFTQDEADEMIRAACAPDSTQVYYEVRANNPVASNELS